MFPDSLPVRSLLLAIALAFGARTITVDAAPRAPVSTVADMQYEPVPDAVGAAVPGSASGAVSDKGANAAVPDDFPALARQCAPDVHPALLGRVASVESSGNPYAIGVVGGHLARQPKSLPEALATVNALDAGGWNYSMGLVQVNVHNLARYGQSAQAIFEPCTNLRTGAAILKACYARARGQFASQVDAVHGALSCYYSGDLARGAAYARKVAAAAPVAGVQGGVQAIEVVPDVRAHPAAASTASPAASGRAGAASGPSSRAARQARSGGDWFTTYGDDQEDGDGAREGQADARLQGSNGVPATDDGGWQ